MSDISVFCHEFGHMLGLPDLYARPENPGSEGVGVWCAMSNQVGGGKPQHFCAWCKEQLGWVKPAVIDPAVKQKLILSPIEDVAEGVLQGAGPARRQRVLPAGESPEEGLRREPAGRGPADLARACNNRPILEESHGVEGADRPAVLPRARCRTPAPPNDAFTPYTTPSSRASSAAACRSTSRTSAACPTAGSRSSSGMSTIEWAISPPLPTGGEGPGVRGRSHSSEQ